MTKTAHDNRILNMESSPLQRHEMNHTPLSLFHRPAVTALATLLFCAVDLICLYSVWNVISVQSPLMLILQAVGGAVLLDVPLAAAGVAMKAYRQSLERKSTAIAVLVTAVVAFLLVFCVTFVFRMVTAEMTYSLSNSTTMINTAATTAASAATESSNIPKVASAWTAILPLGTSIGSFCISYLSADPLGIKIEKLERSIIECEEEVIETERALLEDEHIEQYRAILIDREKAAYEAFCQSCETQGLARKEAAYLAVMETRSTPEEVSELVDDGQALCDGAQPTPCCEDLIQTLKTI